jgi:predicted transcriptional regulator
MDKHEPKNPVSAQLSRAIKKHGHTQEEVGQILGVSSSTVSSMIHGKAVKTLAKIMSKVRQYINNGAVTSKSEEVKAPTPNYSKEAREFTKIHYLRDDNYKPVGCLVAKLITPSIVGIGLSLCNTEHDCFSKKIGRDLAITRANESHKEYRYKFRYISENTNLKKEVKIFLSACMKYYTDKSIILPKIFFTS